ncbi:MAG: hypothetical protein GY756_18355 [bacterium]|nr:hypothetical protein [bacterium]
MKKIMILLLISSLFSCFPFSQNKLKKMIVELEKSNEDSFDEVFGKIKEYISKNLNYRNAEVILNSIHKSFPDRKYEFNDTQRDLIQLLRGLDDERIIKKYNKIFPTVSKNAQREIIFCLTQVNNPIAVNAVITLLNSTKSNPLDHLVFFGWNNDLKYGNLIFPEILDLLSVDNYQYDILYLLYLYISNSKISDIDISSKNSLIIDVLNQYDKKIEILNLDKNQTNWYYTEEYTQVRSGKSLILDILGYINSNKNKEVLKANLHSDDPRIIYFAAQSLLKNEIDVKNEYLERIAKDNEMRKWLFSYFKNNNRNIFTDESYFSQEKLAISDMINWLIYPTELASAPDDIVLEKVITVTKDDGVYDFYLFKFIKYPPHWSAENGWVAGVSGPFKRDDYPTIDGAGYTFSAFSSWDSKTPDEHFEEITGIILKMNKEKI